jgi:hypothetical protein
MGRIGVVFLAFFSLSTQMSARTGREWINVEKLKPGILVRVELWKGVTLSGKLQSADPSKLRVVLTYPWDGRPVEELARADVRRVIHLRHPFLPDPHRAMVGGALIGGATGAAAVALGDKNDCQGCKGLRIVLGGVGGAVLGFVGGAAVEGGLGVVALFHRNQVVYEDTSSLNLHDRSRSRLSSGETLPNLHGY